MDHSHAAPEAGCVRGFATFAFRAELARLFAAVERFYQVDKELLAVLSNGELWSTHLDTIDWHRILWEVDHITSVAAI